MFGTGFVVFVSLALALRISLHILGILDNGFRYFPFEYCQKMPTFAL